MNPFVKQLIAYLTTSKKTVEEVVEKISVKAKASGKSFKEYVQEDANVAHISTVVYDALPFPLRMAIKSEKFNATFIKNFTFIREKLFSDSTVAEANASKDSKAPSTATAASTPVVSPEPAKASTASTVSATPASEPVATPAKKSAPKARKPAAKKPEGTQYTHGPARPPMGAAKKVASKTATKPASQTATKRAAKTVAPAKTPAKKVAKVAVAEKVDKVEKVEKKTATPVAKKTTRKP